MERLTAGQQIPLGGIDEERTYRCPDCLDNGYTETFPLTTTVTIEGRERRVSAGGAVIAWFCDCHTGRAAQAGYWFDAVFPLHGHTRTKSDRGELRLGAYLKARPLERRWLPDAVEHLRTKHENLRKRKLAEVEKT